MGTRQDNNCASTLTLPDGQRAAALKPGDIFGGNLRIVSRIGAGGMGAVYLATDTGPLARSCAVKVLDRVLAGTAGHGRFLAEAKIMAALRHPNIVPVSRFGTDEATGLDFIVMDEFLPSREEAARICRETLHCPCPTFTEEREPLTLARLIDGGKALPEDAVAAIALQLLSAMEAAHALSPPVVHRDIKPSNILFAADGRALLSDFGIAKRLSAGQDGATAAEWTAPHATPGTWAYAAPEQKNGGATSTATDFYSFGLVLFRALTGGMPSASAALPTDIAPRVSKRWRGLFAALLMEDPAKRLADADKVRTILGKIAAEASRRGSRRAYWRMAAMAVVAAIAIWAGLHAPQKTQSEGLRRQDDEDTIGQGLRRQDDGDTTREGLRRQDGEDATREGPRRQDGEDAIVVASQQDEEDNDQPFDNKGWVLQYITSLRKSIESAMDAPMPDGEGRMVVHEGEVLLSGDISFSGKITEIVLDGGEVVFSPSAEQLRGILARCEDFIANAPDDAAMPEDLLPTWRERIDFPIAVTERGGRLDVAEGEITALVAGAVRRATGVEEATLDVFGFSAIVLNRATLDPALRITGAGQIADIGKNGSVRNRRWFDRDDPL